MKDHKGTKNLYNIEDPVGVKEALLFTAKRNFMNVVKRNLNLMEDVRLEHDIFIKKLKEEGHSDIANKMDYLCNDKYNYIRKQILDVGNDSFRDVENFIAMLDINFKKDKGNG